MSYLNTSMVKSALTPVTAAIAASIMGTGAGALAGARQTTGTGGEKAKGAILGGILAGAGAGAGGMATIPIATKLQAKGKLGTALSLAGALAGGYGGYKLKDQFE